MTYTSAAVVAAVLTTAGLLTAGCRVNPTPRSAGRHRATPKE